MTLSGKSGSANLSERAFSGEHNHPPNNIEISENTKPSKTKVVEEPNQNEGKSSVTDPPKMTSMLKTVCYSTVHMLYRLLIYLKVSSTEPLSVLATLENTTAGRF